MTDDASMTYEELDAVQQRLDLDRRTTSTTRVADDRSTTTSAAAPGATVPGGKGKQHSSSWDIPSDMLPKMPCTKRRRQKHRPKTHQPRYNACVARPVSKKEVNDNPKAKAAQQAEWQRLRTVPRPDGGTGVWEESLVEEWRDVKRKALKDGLNIHIGCTFDIIVEKNSELPEDDPKR